MNNASFPANENSHLSFLYDEIGPYTVCTSQLPSTVGFGFETVIIDARANEQMGRTARCQWPRDAKKNHSAALAIARRLEFLGSAKVGEILVSRWGDTHKLVDFFVVVDAGPNSIRIQPCGKKEVPSTSDDFKRRVIPNVDERIGKTIVKRSQRHEFGELTGWNGEPTYESRCA